MTFGGKLRKFRHESGYSLTGLERRCGIDRVSLSRFENGHIANPRFATLEAIAKALGVAPNALLPDFDSTQSLQFENETLKAKLAEKEKEIALLKSRIREVIG